MTSVKIISVPEQGPMGPTGDAGATGAQGPQGPQGIPGPRGFQGDPGTDGDPGGPVGPQGPAGPTGSTGAQGPQGAPGATGAQGPQGAPGATGATGSQGPQGPAGADGLGTPATVPPLMDGAAAVGTSPNFARQDHVHPSDTARVAKAGDTMSGPLTLPGDPTANLHAATKQYADSLSAAGGAALATKVNLAGDTMSGALTVTPKGSLFGGPSGTPATGAVVPADANIKLYDLSGGNWAGFGVDNSGVLWCRTGLSGTPAPAFWVGTDQTVHLIKDPTAPLGVATKQYVDAAAGAGGGFPAGTLMLFQQSAAPTGWTKQTTHNDKALRVVSGAASSGGTNAFSTVFGQTVTGGTALSVANIPAGTFLDTTTSISTSTGSFASDIVPAVTSATLAPHTSGGGTAHTHPMDIRVQYVDLIIAAKN